MEQIKLTQTHAFSSACSAISGSSHSPDSTPTFIDEMLITDEVLGFWRGHRKGVGRIVKRKIKSIH